MVYVVNKEGKPLMPTNRHGKVRKWLNEGKAKVYCNHPFTIQLLFETKQYKQKITLGADVHKEKSAISATTDTRELYNAEIEHRKDVVIKIKKRREYRQSRRNRNSKRQSHNKQKDEKSRKKVKNVSNFTYTQNFLTSLRLAAKILPISKVRMEVAEAPAKWYKSFDWGLNDIPTYYDEDKVSKFATRNYTIVLDNHTCQICHKRKEKDVLVVRSIRDIWDEQANEMGAFDHPEDTGELVTMCKTCAKKYDKKKLKYINGKRNPSKIRSFLKQTSDATKTFRKRNPVKLAKSKYKVYNFIENHLDMLRLDSIERTYGINTKIIRHELGLKYSPINNARVIANPKKINYLDEHHYIKFRRRHDRSIHKVTPKKGGVRPEKAPKVIYGFSSYDEVKYIGKKHPEYYGKRFFITKRRKTGYFGIGDVTGKTIINSVKYDCLKLVRRQNGYIVDMTK